MASPARTSPKAAQFQAVAPFKKKFVISLDKDEKASTRSFHRQAWNFAPTATIFLPGTPTNFWKPSNLTGGGR